MEIWKDIQGYEDYYLISNYGRVQSKDRYINARNVRSCFKRLLKGRLMKPYIGKDGYYYFLLTVDKVSKHLAAHRLVAIHFIDNPENKPEVNHIDTNRLNSHYSNLEWATPKENIQHSIKVGTNKICVPGEGNPASKLKKEQVLQIREMKGSHTAIAKQFNISRRAVGFIKTKQRWAHL